MSLRVHAYIEGRVQGVAYRYATYQRAASLGLTGWVRNLSDGRVEALFEGDEALVRQMADWCQLGPPAAHVTHVDATEETAPPEYTGFSVRH